MRLEVADLRYRYRRAAGAALGDRDEAGAPEPLSGLSFTAESGSYWCVAGPNGSGKSTFLKLVCGLLPERGMSGHVKWDGRALSSWSRLELARGVAFVPGAFHTFHPAPVEDFVLQGRYSHSPSWRLPSAADRDAAREAMERVGIKRLARAAITAISMGEAQLASLARALAAKPAALVLDEATAHLDLRYQARIFGLLDELNREGVTILIVCHDLNLAAEFCPKILWLNQGRAHAAGSMESTLTSDLLESLYGAGRRLDVGRNPFTSRPKVFWK